MEEIMNYWKFTSAAGWFSTSLPDNWSEYDDDEGTYAFFNTDKWSGNLRITPNKWENSPDIASTIIAGELKNNPKAVATKIGKWDAAFFSQKGSDETLNYFWTTGTQNYIFICSFSVDMEFLGTDAHNKELSVVETILGNIEINQV
jgi:hypothetical protein